MRNVFLTVILLLKIFWVNAQNVSVSYTKGFVSDESILFSSNNKVAPQISEQITVAYSKYIGKSYLYLNFKAAGDKKKPPPDPPRPTYPCPECTISYPKAITKGSVIGFKNPESYSVDLLAGLGYTIPHKAGSKLTFSLNVDGGVSINSDQELQIIYDRTVLGSIAFEKYQPIINPSVNMKVALSNRIGINLGGGYSNIGGMNLTTGLNLNLSSDKKKECLHWECCGSCKGFDRGN
jgi:hypothetical protein